MNVTVQQSAVQAKQHELQTDMDEARERGVPVGVLSDGYHSFNELYAMRNAMTVQLCRVVKVNTFKTVWRSKVQSDGTPVQEGWFLIGINKQKGMQITWHLPMSLWAECSFATDLAKAPEYDGHTSADVMNRLKGL